MGKRFVLSAIVSLLMAPTMISSVQAIPQDVSVYAHSKDSQSARQSFEALNGLACRGWWTTGASNGKGYYSYSGTIRNAGRGPGSCYSRTMRWDRQRNDFSSRRPENRGYATLGMFHTIWIGEGDEEIEVFSGDYSDGISWEQYRAALSRILR